MALAGGGGDQAGIVGVGMVLVGVLGDGDPAAPAGVPTGENEAAMKSSTPRPDCKGTSEAPLLDSSRVGTVGVGIALVRLTAVAIGSVERILKGFEVILVEFELLTIEVLVSIDMVDDGVDEDDEIDIDELNIEFLSLDGGTKTEVE